MPVRLDVNDEFTYYGVKFSVHSFEGTDILIMRQDGNGDKVQKVSFYELITDQNFGLSLEKRRHIEREAKVLEKKFVSFYDTLPEEKKQKADEKLEKIKPILLYEKAKGGDLTAAVRFSEAYKNYIKKSERSLLEISKNELMARISKNKNISVSQLKRYLRDFKITELENPTNGKEGLISKKHFGLGPRSDECLIEICHPKNKEIILDCIKLRLDKEYAPLIKEVVEQHYLTKRKPSIIHTYDQLTILCQKRNLKKVGYNTLRKIVNRINKKVIDVLRHGDKALQKYEQNDLGFSRNAKFPLHIVEIDHTELDMDAIDANSGANLGRLWITMGIDVYTRGIWCLHISPDAPSANKVRKALQQGLFFKKVKEQYGTLNEWEICGRPQIIFVDNGPDFKSQDVKRLINEGLNIDIMHRPVKTPKYGAYIERAIGTINKSFIQNLRGNRKSNPMELGDYDAEKEAIFTQQDIEELLTRYIVDIYHHKTHGGLPLDYPTPTAMLYQGISEWGYPDLIPPNEEEAYRIKLLAQDTRKYGNDGIRFENVLYSSKETAKYITRPTTTYQIKYDIDDISYIYLLDPTTGEYNKIYAQRPTADKLAGIGLTIYKKMLEALRDKGALIKNQIPGSKQIDLALELLYDRYNEMISKNKKARNAAIKTGFTLAPVDTTVFAKREGTKSKESEIEKLIQMANFEAEQRRLLKKKE